MTVCSKPAACISVDVAREQGLTCDRVLFYAFGASYPDGSCHEGRLTDDDSDYISEDGAPCPLCNAEEYGRWTEEDDIPRVFVCPL